MTTPILATKLYIPPPWPNIILRPRLIERLNEGIGVLFYSVNCVDLLPYVTENELQNHQTKVNMGKNS